jgi:heme-degrading monooxygenase HmoA
MFAYILRVHAPYSEEGKEFFQRFKQEPGLLHAYDLQGVDDPDDAVLLAVWETREAAERYLNEAPLRREVDQAYPTVTRTKYEVLDSK